MRRRATTARYLTLRADTLMGLFRRLPTAARRQALAALARSTAEHGGDSARRYLASHAGDTAALIDTIERTAAQLGWGKWRFGRRGRSRLSLTVTDSPFAAGYGASRHPVCAPILGMLEAVAGLALGGPCTVRELRCRACGAPRCRFEAVLRKSHDAQILPQPARR
jgi:predicted hydrocarbon binding protein